MSVNTPVGLPGRVETSVAHGDPAAVPRARGAEHGCAQTALRDLPLPLHTPQRPCVAAGAAVEAEDSGKGCTTLVAVPARDGHGTATVVQSGRPSHLVGTHHEWTAHASAWQLEGDSACTSASQSIASSSSYVSAARLGNRGRTRPSTQAQARLAPPAAVPEHTTDTSSQGLGLPCAPGAHEPERDEGDSMSPDPPSHRDAITSNKGGSDSDSDGRRASEHRMGLGASASRMEDDSRAQRTRHHLAGTTQSVAKFVEFHTGHSPRNVCSCHDEQEDANPAVAWQGQAPEAKLGTSDHRRACSVHGAGHFQANEAGNPKPGDDASCPATARSGLKRMGTEHHLYNIHVSQCDVAGDAMSRASSSTAGRLGFAMPRVAVQMWDDVVDAHVPDDVARGSDKEDEAPWSPKYQGAKRAASFMARCCTKVARVAKRTLLGLYPGHRQSRIMYEQLKWGPVILSVLLLAVPLCLDGATLNRWMFALVFHALYFWISLGFALTSFALLYPLPPLRHVALYTTMSTAGYLSFVAVAITYLSGRALLYVLPAALMFVVTLVIMFLLHSAISTCVVAVAPQDGQKTPSIWGILTGRIPVHTRKRPVVGPGSAVAGSTPLPVHKFVLNADALLPVRRLFVAFALIAVSFYWFQVYTTSLSVDLNELLHDEEDAASGDYGVATILVFEFALFLVRRLMRVITNPVSLVRVGIPETSSRGLGTVLVHAVTVRGSFFERLLFMNFKSTENLETVVLQRTALHIGVDLVTMSPWYHRLRNKAIVAMHKCMFPSRPAIKLRNFDEYLFDQQSINMFAHIANFTSLVTWVLALVWFRFGYNAPVLPFGSGESSDEQFWRLLQFGGILALSELGELLFIRVLAVCRGDRVRYFDRALRHMRHRAARLAFVVVAAHMLQDAMVAMVRLEPNSG